MEPVPSPKRVRIGDFLFEPATGEVRPLGEPTQTGSTRLSPQPATLLEILIEKNGELATREEIRARLWPDTHVDFDQSLHFCVRQIRSALGDSANTPTYVETLPRRGYRLMRPVEPAAPDPLAPGGREEGAPRHSRRGAYALLSIALVAGGLLLARACATPRVESPIRLAIMPFELAAAGGARSGGLTRLSETLLVELSRDWNGRLEVVGPRSTAVYSAFPFPEMDRLADDLAIDYVLNARFLAAESGGDDELIVELIRLDDGSHPWAERFAASSSWEEIASEVITNVVRALRLRPP